MMKKKIIIVDLILCVVFASILIVAIWATQNWASLERLTLISIIILVAIGGIPLLNSLLSEIPKFEVLNPRVRNERVVDRVSHVSVAKTEKHEVETKAVYIDIKNKNPDADLKDCKIGIVIDLGDWATMNLENLIPDLPQTICLFRLFSNSFVVSNFKFKNQIKIDVGKVHDLNIRFFGDKFINKKIWHMELDFILWDSCNFCFKTRRGVLKKRIGGRKDE